MVSLLAAVLLLGCSATEDPPQADPEQAEWSVASTSSDAAAGEVAGEEERAPFDEDAAKEAAESDISDETYVGVGMPYGCTEDCSGHDAGFRYRAENGYVGYNPDSPSFNEGGQAFEDAVDERIEEMREQYESGDDTPF